MAIPSAPPAESAEAPPATAGALAAMGFGFEARAALQAQAEALATRLRLPLRAATGGLAGQWLGAGMGASLEFQDHRPYQPGDDPRYLNWAAYARTGHYTMKLYREEVSPRIDVVLDCSPSMFLRPEKARRTLELFAFVNACAARTGSRLRAFQAVPDHAGELPADSLRNHSWEPLPHAGRLDAPALHRIPWRPQSLRVLVTDLLYPAPPENVLGPLLHSPGRAVLFCPWSNVESDPDWNGQVELRDCESEQRRLFQISPARLARYRANYRRHFALWDEACRSRGVALARVADTGSLLDKLLETALPASAVELCP